MLTAFLVGFNTFFSTLWSLVFIFSQLFGLKLNLITGQKLNSFLPNVKIASVWANDEPHSWICGWLFIGYICSGNGNGSDSTRKLYLFSTNKFYKNVVCKENDDDKEGDDEKNDDSNYKNNDCDGNKEGNDKTDDAGGSGGTKKKSLKGKITFCERELKWGDVFCYASRQYSPILKPIWENQQSIIDKILQIYMEKTYASSLICGPPKKGKSYIPIYLCYELIKLKNIRKVYLVDTWNPAEPGDDFVSLYNKFNPQKDSPMVIVLEEVDGLVTDMHNGDIKLSVYAPKPIQIKSKKDWNQFFDRFDRQMYPYVIIIMTSNQNTDFFDQKDPSYMREGRVNYKIDME